MKKKPVFFVVLLLCMMLCGCSREERKPQIINYEIEHEQEFGGVYIKITIDDFNRLGFEYGDSVNVKFSNGYELNDIPYYNGYYVDAGEPLLIAYPGYDYIKAAINYGEDLWERAHLQSGLQAGRTLWQASGLDEHSKADVVLNEKGKYKDIQEARDIHYSDERSKFDSDVIFANFRVMNFGNLKDNVFYRSASPCDNQHKRAPYVDALIKEAGVNCIMNLADNTAKIEKYMAADDFNSPYFKELYDSGKVLPLALNMNYLSEDFAQKIASGFKQMTELEPPYLIHCTEGKDRTGFVCMLVEMLASTPYQQIADDYMVTYDNYYKINPSQDKAKYDVILEKNLNAMLKFVVGDETVDYRNVDLSPYAQAYLLKAGMSEEELNSFLNKICK